MPKSNPNIDFFAGNRRILEFTVTDADDAGNPLDLTNLTLKWAAVKGTVESYGKTPVLERPVVITDGPNGKCEVDIRSQDTASFAATSYYHQLEGTDTIPESEVLAFGTFTLLVNIEEAP